LFLVALKLATLNINACTAPTRIQMLDSFLKQNEIDILLVQEVTQHVLHNILGYTTHYNIGTHGRGLALLYKDCIEMTNVKIPSGRAIAAQIWIVNVYAPSWTVKKQERESVFTSELTYILAEPTTLLLVGGDFNSVLDKADSTGHYIYSPTLNEMAQGLAVQDIWQNTHGRRAYTHYSTNCAPRIDRIYVSKGLLDRKVGAETIMAPSQTTPQCAYELRRSTIS
jgi:exonuclease III